MIPLRLYLPYASYPLLVHVLDAQRLGQMPTQIMHIIWDLQRPGPRSEWSGHPAIEMWRGYETSLLRLLDCALREQRLRGWQVEMRTPRTQEDARHWGLRESIVMGPVVHPVWLGCTGLHASHRACLRFFDAEWYQQFDWDERAQFRYWVPQRPAQPGDYLVDRSDAVWLVESRVVDTESVVIVSLSDGSLREIADREVVRREWTIGIPLSLHEASKLGVESAGAGH